MDEFKVIVVMNEAMLKLLKDKPRKRLLDKRLS